MPFTIVPKPSDCPDEAYSETGTVPGGTVFLEPDSLPVLGYNQFSTLAHKDVVDYVILVSGIAVEWGIGVYNAIIDDVVRQVVLYTSTGVGEPFEIPDPPPPTQIIARRNVNPETVILPAARPETAGLMHVPYPFSESGRWTGGSMLRMRNFLLTFWRDISIPTNVQVPRHIQVLRDSDVTTLVYQTNAAGTQLLSAYWAGGTVRIPPIQDAARDIVYEINSSVPGSPSNVRQIFVKYAKGLTDAQLQVLTQELIGLPNVKLSPAQIASIKDHFPSVVIPPGATVNINAGTPGVGHIFTEAEKIYFKSLERNAKITVAEWQAATGIKIPGAPITRIFNNRLVILGVTAIPFVIEAYTQVRTLQFQNNEYMRAAVNQGRLQTTNEIARFDSERRGSTHEIQFVPCWQDEPQEARITLYTPAISAGVPRLEKIHFPIATTNGTVPFLDITKPSPMPFFLDLDRIQEQNVVGDGNDIPADIFICWPSSLANLSESPETGAFRAPPPVQNPARLPRLFYLNWHSQTSRNNGEAVGFGRVGFDLVDTPELGLCLDARKVQDGGFIVNNVNLFPKDYPLLYRYLGTMVRYAGIVSCEVGLRNLWNMYNRLTYAENPQMVPLMSSFHKQARQGFRARFSNTENYASHQFVDPTDANFTPAVKSILPTISTSLSGSFRTNIVGPIAVDVKHRQNNVYLRWQFIVPGVGLVDDVAYAVGTADCVPKKVHMTNLKLREDFVEKPGANEIVAYQLLDADIDCTQKRYGYGNTFPETWFYNENVGAFPFNWTGRIPIPADCVNNVGRFGFSGSC